MDKDLFALLERGRKARTAQEQVDEAYAEEMGYDAGLNGPNGTNSHFAIFHSRAMTDAWERGKKRGDSQRCSPPQLRQSNLTKE